VTSAVESCNSRRGMVSLTWLIGSLEYVLFIQGRGNQLLWQLAFDAMILRWWSDPLSLHRAIFLDLISRPLPSHGRSAACRSKPLLKRKLRQKIQLDNTQRLHLQDYLPVAICPCSLFHYSNIPLMPSSRPSNLLNNHISARSSD